MALERRSSSSEILHKLDVFNDFLKTIKVGTDIDNTEIATTANGIKIVNYLFGTNFQLIDMQKDFAIVDLLRTHVVKIKDPRRAAVSIWNSRWNLSQAPPVPGALLVSKYLFDNGIGEVSRISSRPAFTYKTTLNWYGDNMPWVDPKLIHIQTKGQEVNSAYKVDMVQKYDINLFFEDVPAHAESIVAGTNALVALVPQEMNKNYKPINSRIIQVPQNYLPKLPAFVRTYFYLAHI